jgi:hypothetical protein
MRYVIRFFGEVAKRTDHTIVLKNLKVPYRLSIGVQWRIMGNHIGVFLLIGDHKSQGKNTYKSAGCTRVKHQAGFPDHLFWGGLRKNVLETHKNPATQERWQGFVKLLESPL